MKTKHDIQQWLFIATAFLLGSMNVLYHSIFYTFFIAAFVYNIAIERQNFIEHVKKSWKYLVLPLGAVIYLVIHYLITLSLGSFSYRVSWSSVELLLLYFLMIPLYIVSARTFITPRLIKQFLFALCWGVLVFNFIKLFYLTGGNLFTAPQETLKTIYNGRFGGNLFLLKGFVLLEAQALYLAVTSVISTFFIFKSILSRSWNSTFVSSIIIFLFSLLFLSFTVTKASILAFIAGFLFLTLACFFKMSLKQRLVGICVLLVCGLGSYLIIPSSLKERIKDMNNEISLLKQGNISGGTVAPRIALWEEDFKNFDEWGLFGLGVYKKYAVREWYQNSSYTFIRDLKNTHNSFLDSWLLGGIPGLLFFCFYFFAPVWKMIRQKKISFLIIALLLTIAITNNTCLLIALVDTNPMILFMFALFYFQLDSFYQLDLRTIKMPNT